MMMYLVEKDFIDKKTKKLHKADTIYRTDKEDRAKELRDKGFIGVELIVKEETEVVKEEKESKKGAK